MESDIVLNDRQDEAYDLSSYYVSRSIVDIPLQILAITIMSVIGYFVVGLNLDDAVSLNLDSVVRFFFH